MADIRSTSQGFPHEDKVRESHQTRQMVDMTPPGNAHVSAAHWNRSPSTNHYHTAFMQCRACCDCDGGCSYYGKGKFDSDGNYLGS